MATLEEIGNKLDQIISILTAKPAPPEMVARFKLVVMKGERPPVQDGRSWLWLNERSELYVEMSADGGQTWFRSENPPTGVVVEKVIVQCDGSGNGFAEYATPVIRALSVPGPWTYHGTVIMKGGTQVPIGALGVWVWPTEAPRTTQAFAQATAASRWVPVTEAQYRDADKLPVCRDNTEVDLAIERARHGRLPWANSLSSPPSAVVSYLTLSEGLAEFARITALPVAERAKHWSYLHRISDDLLGAICCLGHQAGLPDWQEPYRQGLSSSGTVAQLAGQTFASWLQGAFQGGTGGTPSGG